MSSGTGSAAAVSSTQIVASGSEASYSKLPSHGAPPLLPLEPPVALPLEPPVELPLEPPVELPLEPPAELPLEPPAELPLLPPVAAPPPCAPTPPEESPLEHPLAIKTAESGRTPKNAPTYRILGFCTVCQAGAIGALALTSSADQADRAELFRPA